MHSTVNTLSVRLLAYRNCLHDSRCQSTIPENFLKVDPKTLSTIKHIQNDHHEHKVTTNYGTPASAKFV